jgi:chromosome partitioning protein
MIAAVLMQKGGCSKTTVTLNLATIAALEGKKTCLVDMDPQGNLTKTFTQLQEGQPTIANILKYSTSFQETIIETPTPNLFLIPAQDDLSTLERSEATNPRISYLLKEALQLAAKNFDLILIDTPPTLGALTINAMVAAQYLIIPIEPSVYGMQGANALLLTYTLVKKNLNPSLSILGVLISMYDPGTRIAKEAEEEIRKVFKEKVLTTMIHRSIKLKEAPAVGQSIVTYSPKSKAAQEYREAYRELMSRV